MNDLIKTQMALSLMEEAIATRKKKLKMLKFLTWVQLFLSGWMIALGISLIVKNPTLAAIDLALGIFNGVMHIKGRKDIEKFKGQIAEAELELRQLKAEE